MLRMPRKSTLALALAALLAAGCNRCGTSTREIHSAAELAPANADGVVMAPQLARLGQKTQRLSQLKIFGLLASLAGLGNDGSAFLGDLKQQLGFDFTTADGLASVGLDPNGELLSAHLPSGAQLAVVAIAKPDTFAAAMEKLAKERLRAPSRTEADGVIAYAPMHGVPVLAWGRAGKYAVLGTGPQCHVAVGAALKQLPTAALSSRADFTAYQTANAHADLLVWAPPGSPLQQFGIAGLQLAATLEDHRAVASIDLPLTTEQATALGSMQGPAGSELVTRLDPEAFFVARTAMDPATLWPLALAAMPPQLGRQLVAAGVKPAEVLQNFKPGAAMSLALPQSLDLARMPSFDPRDTNPFRYVYLAGLGHVKDPAAVSATMASMQKFQTQLGLQLSQPAADKPLWTFSYALGEGASVAVDGDLVALSGGEKRMAPLLARQAGQGWKVPDALAPRFNQAGLAVWLDMPRFVAALRSQPDSAFGLGGFAIKAALLRWLDALDEIRGALLLADAKPDATGTKLHLELQANLP
ncbi:MAG: hypothetical protein JST54_18185 [Deltaproteobacteria bacterium]|nr:hypothetical protein [Deltaproteobacteria bacterium]